MAGGFLKMIERHADKMAKSTLGRLPFEIRFLLSGFLDSIDQNVGAVAGAFLLGSFLFSLIPGIGFLGMASGLAGKFLLTLMDIVITLFSTMMWGKKGLEVQGVEMALHVLPLVGNIIGTISPSVTIAGFMSLGGEDEEEEIKTNISSLKKLVKKGLDRDAAKEFLDGILDDRGEGGEKEDKPYARYFGFAFLGWVGPFASLVLWLTRTFSLNQILFIWGVGIPAAYLVYWVQNNLADLKNIVRSVKK